MSHLHIPDGILPWWIVVAGWLLTGMFLTLAIRRLPTVEVRRRLPLLGVVTAMMVIAMSIEIVPIAYHINLAVLAGILLGPALGFVAAFLVNIITALFGHGGVTVIGLNALTTGIEPVLGVALFRAFAHLFHGRGPGLGWSAAVATVATLFASTLVMVGIIALARVNPGIQLGGGSEPVTVGFRNPLTHGVVTWEVFAADHEAAPSVSIQTFAAVVFFLGFWGWLLEAAVTALVVRYLARVRPDLIQAAIGGR